MRLLLDTHALLWALAEPRKLSSRARRALEAPANDLLWSAAGTWELAILVALGRVSFDEPLATFLPGALQRLGVRSLPIEDAHAIRVAHLPPIHRDPFDRMLVAQALVEDLTLVTKDPQIRRYGARTLW